MSDLQKHAIVQAILGAAMAAATFLTHVDWSATGSWAPFLGMGASAIMMILTEYTVGTKN